ncbi:snRNA-activating protein complex subunit 4-like isoform X1 [Planococcus citri]|uniref:snRNA-activating protein complex subunit 4-like isoform X1 n=1 Tax=Planococcus citri TaxID=170843 RepID=UPI0031F91AF9
MDSEDECDDSADRPLTSIQTNDSSSKNTDEKTDENTPEYTNLSNVRCYEIVPCIGNEPSIENVPCTDYIVPCDDDIRTDFSEDDDNGNEIIREIKLITPAASIELDQNNDRVLNDLIVNCIQDERLRNELLDLNAQLERNIESCNKVAAEAMTALLEKKNLIKEYKIIGEKLERLRSADTVKLKRVKKKISKHSAETGHNRHSYFCRFGIPYFKDRARYQADYNADLRELYCRNQLMLFKLPKTRRFLKKDAKSFDTLVLQQLKNRRVDQLNLFLKNVNKEIVSVHGHDTPDELLERRRKIQDAIKETLNVSDLRDTKVWNIKVNFSALPIDETQYRFRSEDYERLWNLLANPDLNREDFTPDETSKMKDLAAQYGAQDWDRIAQLLGTNRSAFACFTKYVSVIKKGKNIPWTKEEDELLLKLGSKMNVDDGKKGTIYHWWRTIRRHFPHRTYSQIHAHWSYVLAPQLKKGRFTKEEHRVIMKYKKENKSYSEIAKLVGSRSCVQIRAHFENYGTTSNVKIGAWTRDEEAMLLELIREHGDKNWVTISESIKTRNRTQCRLKYVQMKNNPNPRHDPSSDEGKNYRKGRWTAEENEIFAKLLEKYGCRWAKISKEMKTRSRLQCSVKYKADYKMKEKQTNEKKTS